MSEPRGESMAQECIRCEDMGNKPHTNAEHIELYPPNTINEWMLSYGSNLDNHTATLAGRGKFIKVGRPDTVIFRTQQEIYRFCAHLMAQAALLPNEERDHTYEEIEHAIRNA